MKKTLVLAAVCAAIFASCSREKTSLQTGGSAELDTLSYALGTNIAYTIKFNMGDLPLNYDKFYKALDDVARSKNTITNDEAIQTLDGFFGKLNTDSIGFASPEQCDSVSYAFGFVNAYGLNENKIPAQLKWIKAGIEDVRAGQAKLDEEQTINCMRHYFLDVVPAEALKRSEDFLARIEKKSGWKKTDSGLLYKIVKEGSETERATSMMDRVVVHYKGLNMDGEQFDSSYDRGEPAEFRLNSVIRGWGEGMQLIGKGGKIKMWLHPNLAYGPRQMSPEIGPNAALYFEVELLDVHPDITNMPAPETTEEPAEAAETQKSDSTATK